ncbi:MAG: sigma-70 family RNA polymerase sigma factor, partial [Thermoanaerobaculia bacterium]
TRGSVLTWLLVATRSRAIDRLRARRSGGRARLRPLDDVPEAASSEDLESGLAGREWEALCRAAIGELPEDQRRALELAYFEGLTQQEIAERTKTPLGTVKTRVRLGLMKLRERIRPYLSERRDAS